MGTKSGYGSLNVVLFSTASSTVMCVNVNHVQAFFAKKVFDSIAAPCCWVHVCAYTQPRKGDFLGKAVETCWTQRCAMLTKKRMARYAKEVRSTSSDMCLAVCLIASQAAKDD